MVKYGKRVQVVNESNSGHNLLFVDVVNNQKMTRAQFARAINKGEYPSYYTRDINGLETPVSKPDNVESNNLG